MNHDSTNPQMHRSATRFRASQLIDCKITNARGDSLGDVQDIVLANDNRSIAYVVVGFGGFLGMGEKFFAMPWRLIKATRSTMDTEPRMTLNVDQEVLEAAPGFDKDKWPDMADKTWSRQVDDFYSTRGLPADAGTMSRTSGTPLTDTRTGNSYGRDPNSEAFHYRRMSQLLGMEVVDGNRENLAKIDDLVVDAERAQIEGAALSYGGVMGMGKHIALVPMESLTLDRNKGTFVLSCTTEDLEALALRGGEWSVLDSDEWLARGRNRFAGTSNTRRDQGAASTWGA